VARLKEITVDPKTVVLAKKVDPNSVGAPKPATDLTPGTYKYNAVIVAGGQKIPISLSTIIKEENGNWSAVDTMKTPTGEATDTELMEKGTLVLRKRNVKQGPASINVEFANNKATGNMNMGGQDRAISADLGGPLFADAAGSMQSIACLPLAEG